MNKTSFKKIGEIEVFIREDGKFEAKIAGKTVTKRALSEIEREISKQAGALPAYQLSRYMHSPKKVEILGFENGRARLKEDGRLSSYGYQFYIIDENTLEILARIRTAIRDLEERWTDEVNSLERVNERNFEEIRSRLSAK